jgi:hypothetical protein
MKQPTKQTLTQEQLNDELMAAGGPYILKRIANMQAPKTTKPKEKK